MKNTCDITRVVFNGVDLRRECRGRVMALQKQVVQKLRTVGVCHFRVGDTIRIDEFGYRIVSAEKDGMTFGVVLESMPVGI